MLALTEDTGAAEVRSVHRKRPDLYRFEVVAGQLVIRIEDPDTFWRISRFLIVELR